MDFLKIFTISRYHRVIKVLKILTSNSKQFRVYGILKNDKLMMIEVVAKYYIFLDFLYLK